MADATTTPAAPETVTAPPAGDTVPEKAAKAPKAARAPKSVEHRIEEYEATKPDGTTVTVIHNIDTGETRVAD